MATPVSRLEAPALLQGPGEAEVGEEALLGEVGDGFKVAMSALENGRYSVAAGCVGICEGCVQSSVDYAKERVQFGKPIANFQLIQVKLANMLAEITNMQLMCLRLSQLLHAPEAPEPAPAAP